MERIKAMGTEEMRQPYGSYFKKTAAFILQVGKWSGEDGKKAGQVMQTWTLKDLGGKPCPV